VTAWVWVFICAWVLLAGVFALGLGRRASREMPPYTPPRPWQHDPTNLARCPGCGTLRPLDAGLIAAHDRPDPWVPYDQQSTPCQGAGQQPAPAKASER
jgi:hypothetical protein